MKIRKIKKSKNPKSEKFKNSKFSHEGQSSQSWKIEKNENLKNLKIQNFHTRGLTPRYENQKNENFNHAIFKGCRIHVPHAPSSRITMMNIKDTIGWSADGLHHGRFTTSSWIHSSSILTTCFILKIHQKYPPWILVFTPVESSVNTLGIPHPV